MQDYQLNLFPSSDDLFKAFSLALAEKINSLARQQQHIHLCLSGGNSPKAVFVLLVKHYATSVNWEQVHFYWSDERCVPSDNSESNYGMAKQGLLDPLNIKAEQIHFIDGMPDPETEAQRYTEVLLQQVPQQQSLPRFDLLILGLGEDGHTASIFPHNIALLNDPRLCVVSQHPISGQNRISLSGGVLNNAANTWFLISGKSKARVFTEILHNDKQALHYPGYHIRPRAGELVYFADYEAVDKTIPPKNNEIKQA